MSDGGKEIGRDSGKTPRIPAAAARGEGGDDFGRSVAKLAVAQVCDSIGFHGCRRSVVDALADALVCYIQDLGKASSFYANLSCRSICNEFDVIQGLGDLESTRGFLGALDIQRCLVGSGVIGDLIQFFNTMEEIPFARPVPTFPVLRKEKQTPGLAQRTANSSGKHIPDWLPSFPESHTYIHTPVWHERTAESKADKLGLGKQKRKGDKALINLEQRLATDDVTGEPTLVFDGDAGKGKHIIGSSNPFLVPPMPFGEKQVTEIVIPAKGVDRKIPSIIETFAPAIEAAKFGTLDSGINENKILPSRRRVNFRLGIDKKAISSTFSSLGPWSSKNDSWFSRDDEKDDKKRRVAMIIREAMEKPDGLAQS